jgi:hypothetical protein
MAEFRCKMLNERGRTLFSADFTADTLTRWRDPARRRRSSHEQLVLAITACLYAFEVWSGTSRLFPPPLNA